MKPGFKSALEKYTQQATGSASVCVRQFSSTKDRLSVDRRIHGSKKFCGSAFASGRVRSPHIYVVVLLLCIENIDSIYRFDISYRTVSYRRRKYRHFRHIGITFLYIILPNSHFIYLFILCSVW